MTQEDSTYSLSDKIKIQEIFLQIKKCDLSRKTVPSCDGNLTPANTQTSQHHTYSCNNLSGDLQYLHHRQSNYQETPETSQRQTYEPTCTYINFSRWFPFLHLQWFSATPRNLSEMQILRPIPDLLKQTLRMGPSTPCF